MTQLGLWVGFAAVVLTMLAVDLGIVNRKARVISVGEAGRWTPWWSQPPRCSTS